MPPEYLMKGEYEKGYERLKAELREEYKGELFKLKKQIQEQRAGEEEREKLISRFWMERMVYIAIIIATVTLIVTTM